MAQALVMLERWEFGPLSFEVLVANRTPTPESSPAGVKEALKP